MLTLRLMRLRCAEGRDALTRGPRPAANLQRRLDVVVCNYMLTVPEAAKRARRNPETIRRWIRSGRLRAHKVGTQHVIEESDLEQLMVSPSLPVPERWRRFESGRPQPDWVTALANSRSGR